jgi:polyvinyl alcohol dehydrogenase (cytochrome)
MDLRKRALVGIAGMFLAAGPALPQTIRSGSPPTISSWPKYGGTLSMSGTPTGISEITPSTVRRLILDWHISLDGPVASAPSVFGGRLYVGDWAGIESAINVQTGAVIARADLGRTHAPQCDPSALGITSSPALINGRLYVAGGDDAFYALNRDTLAVIWRHSLGDNSENGGYYGWSSPAVVDNRILQGVASNCDTPFVPGRLVALDRLTGEEVASASFTTGGKVGNGVWTSPAVDVRNHKIFVTTASGLDYKDGFGYSIVRLNLDTLAIEDSWKVNPDDASWDADWGSSPTQFEDRRGRQLVGAGHKDGHYYAFKRASLAEGPIWTAVVAQAGEVPQAGDGTLSTAAFDGTRLYVGGGVPPGPPAPYVAGSVVALDPTDGSVEWRQMFPGPVIAPVSVVNGVVFAAGGNLIAALDAATGEVLWSFRTAAPIYGGIAISGDAVFVGDLAGKLYAFRLFFAPGEAVMRLPKELR